MKTCTPGKLYPLFLCASIILLLSGCAAMLANRNTMDMTDTIRDIRNEQVENNILIALDNPDAGFIPSHIVLTTGQADVTIGTSSSGFNFLDNSLRSNPFSNARNFEELDLGGNVQWKDQWQFVTPTDRYDLLRLRDVYALVVPHSGSDTKLPYFGDKKLADIADRLGRLMRARDVIKDVIFSTDAGNPGSEEEVCRTTPALPPCNELKKAYAALKAETEKDPRHYFISQIFSSFTAHPAHIDFNACLTDKSMAKKCNNYCGTGDRDCRAALSAWHFILEGDSEACKKYITRHLGDKWITRAGQKKNADIPDDHPFGIPHGIGSVATIHSQACFDDFVLLVQGMMPAATQNAGSGTRLTLP